MSIKAGKSIMKSSRSQKFNFFENDGSFRPIPGPKTKKARFSQKSRMQEFRANNMPSSIKKIGSGNTVIPTLKLVGYESNGKPIYENVETPKHIKQKGSTKHPKSHH
jgi:hypothetical protein